LWGTQPENTRDKTERPDKLLLSWERLTRFIHSGAVERDELIRKMRARVEQCRRLADSIGNPEARRTLLHMADEGEADIRKLEVEQGTSSA
jgi:hypothetical protein